MQTTNHNSGTVYGTITGTVLTIFGNIHIGDLVKTALLATIGATVSFGVSLALKKMSRRFRVK
ncbi:MAG TPA: hypothetical protein VD927_19815 [Chryseosolibacter sp.]|nr:hypothetical protein [Chryseosolibacter sp.]